MKNRHRVNASHSAASKAKPDMERLRREIKRAVARMDLAEADRLKKELAWLQINTSGAF